MDCSPSGSSVHGILQARVLEWLASPFSKGSSWPREPTNFCVAGGFFTHWATWEAHELGTFFILSHLITLRYSPFYRKETESAEMTYTLSKVIWLTVGGVGTNTQLWLQTPFFKPLCSTVVVFGITYSCEIFITAVFGHSFVEIPNTIMVSSLSLLKLTIQWYVQEKRLSLPSSWVLCLQPGSLLAGLAQWAVTSSESLVHSVSWWWPELDSLHTCFSRTAFWRYPGGLSFS